MRYLLLLFMLLFQVKCFALEIKAPFENGAEINSRYTCDADNLSPQINWSAVPSGTKSFVLICDDPDSPSKAWSHWVVFNIPADKVALDEGMPVEGELDNGIIQGVNDFGKPGYYGPCPPPTGPHRYFFRLYALDTTLALDENSTREAVLAAISNHILSQAETFGTYQR